MKIKSRYMMGSASLPPKRKSESSAFHPNKGFTQIDYIIATGIFLVVFALVIQYVGNFFGGIAATTTARLMTTEATDLLSIADDSAIPETWPYFAPGNDVVLYMHLDNSTLDSSRYGNNGVASGADCIANVTGRLGGACSFDGINDYITTQTSAIPSGPFTVAGWASSKTSSGYVVWQMETQVYFTGSSITAGLWNGATSYAVSSNSDKTNNTWYHFTFVYNGTHIMLYVDGVNESAPVSASGSAVSGTMYLGRDETLVNMFNGTIDEVVVWNRSLTADEVHNIYYYENTLRRIGLNSPAYRLTIVLNNSRAAWRDQSKTWVNITDELVRFNYTDIGLPASVSSTTIYDDSGSQVPYNINGSVITFVTPITVNSTRNFTVYFDDDENFIEKSTSATGFDNLTEKLFPAQRIDVVQYKKIMFLNSSDYALVKNATGVPRDFRLTLLDLSGSTVFTFGPDVPNIGNVFAARRFVVYQNSTGAVRRGSISIQVW